MDEKLYWYRALCTQVIDGDTIQVNIELGLKVNLTERVRLYGIDSSEIFGVKMGSPEYTAGMLCKNRVVELILNKPIWINTIKDRQEKYGRFLANIYFLDTNGQYTNLNELLVSEGLAKKYGW